MIGHKSLNKQILEKLLIKNYVSRIKVNKELNLRLHIESIYNFELFKYFYIIIVSKEL